MSATTLSDLIRAAIAAYSAEVVLAQVRLWPLPDLDYERWGADLTHPCGSGITHSDQYGEGATPEEALRALIRDLGGKP